MASVAFYHLTAWPLERALPKLLEKTLEGGRRAIVIAGSEERVEALANALWTSEPDSWLPHGTIQDGSPEDQPIWLTTGDDNANGAHHLYLTDGADSDRIDRYERCFELFDGGDADAVEAARTRWRARQAAGHAVTYWQQDDQGRWRNKA